MDRWIRTWAVAYDHFPERWNSVSGRYTMAGGRILVGTRLSTMTLLSDGAGIRGMRVRAVEPYIQYIMDQATNLTYWTPPMEH